MKKFTLKLITLAMLTSCALVVTGCNSDLDSKKDIVTINRFEIDQNTLNNSAQEDKEKKEEQQKEENNEQSKIEQSIKDLEDAKQEYIENDNYTVGELEITGNNTEITWTISGENVIYNNTEFIGLVGAVNSVDAPCNKDNIIKYIVENFKPSYPAVMVTYNLDNEEIQSDIGRITLDELLRDDENYQAVKAKYDNTPVNWGITIQDGGAIAHLMGCSKYMIYVGGDKSISVDFGTDNETPEQSNTETVTESTVTESTVTEPTVSEPTVSGEEISNG